MVILLSLALAMHGLVTGIYVATLIHDHRIDLLSADQYRAMHQMRDRSFRHAMPVLGLTTLGLVAASTGVAIAAGPPRYLGAAALALLLADTVLTVRRQLPINRQIQGWSAATVPADWQRWRDRWAFQHRVRSVLAGASYLCFLGAVAVTRLR